MKYEEDRCESRYCSSDFKSASHRKADYKNEKVCDDINPDIGFCEHLFRVFL